MVYHDRSLIEPPLLDDGLSSRSNTTSCAACANGWLVDACRRELDVDFPRSMKGAINRRELDFNDRSHGWITSSARSRPWSRQWRPSSLTTGSFLSSSRPAWPGV